MILDPEAFTPEDQPVEVVRVRHANVQLPDGTVLRDTLAIVTTRRVYVVEAGARRGEGHVRFVAEHDQAPTDIKRPRLLSTAPLVIPLTGAAGRVSIGKGQGCGCGGWNLNTYTLTGTGPVRSGT